MRILCGTDIIEVRRIKESIERSGDKFINILFTPAEIEYCESKRNAKYYHYAGRFAAKEAIFKAISSRLKDKFEMSWKDVEILNNEMGRPKVFFINKTLESLTNIDISLSHCKEYAVANVVASWEE